MPRTSKKEISKIYRTKIAYIESEHIFKDVFLFFVANDPADANKKLVSAGFTFEGVQESADKDLFEFVKPGKFYWREVFLPSYSENIHLLEKEKRGKD